MGSSGGASGKVDFPTYMKTLHGHILDHDNVDHPVISAVGAFNYAASGSSPYLSFITNSDPVAGVMFADGLSMDDYGRLFELLGEYKDFDVATTFASYQADVVSYDDLVGKIGTSLDDDIAVNVLPKFKANLRSIGAVTSSAFAIGESLIWASKEKALAKEAVVINDSLLKHKDFAWRQTLAMIEYKKHIVIQTQDAIKLFYALKTELDDHYSTMHEKDLKWDLDLLQYVNNTLAAISGSGHPTGGGKSGSKVGSALSGALSGAAMGASIPGAGAFGAAAGGFLGLAGGLFG